MPHISTALQLLLLKRRFHLNRRPPTPPILSSKRKEPPTITPEALLASTPKTTHLNPTEASEPRSCPISDRSAPQTPNQTQNQPTKTTQPSENQPQPFLNLISKSQIDSLASSRTPDSPTSALVLTSPTPLKDAFLKAFTQPTKPTTENPQDLFSNPQTIPSETDLLPPSKNQDLFPDF